LSHEKDENHAAFRRRGKKEFTLGLAEFVCLRSSADTACELLEGNATLSVEDSLEISLRILKIHSLEHAHNLVRILEVNTQIGCRCLHR
jgi:hypothetical protein